MRGPDANAPGRLSGVGGLERGGGAHRLAMFVCWMGRFRLRRWAADRDVVVSTYTMVSFGGARHPDTQALIDAVAAREWGLLVMDEVHVVPAAMFRRVIGLVKAHAKLGLTATLVREDDLARAGHIANVSCAEVLCPLAPEFAAAYLNGANAGRRTLLATLNPTKFAACRALIAYHEAQGDKVYAGRWGWGWEGVEDGGGDVESRWAGPADAPARGAPRDPPPPPHQRPLGRPLCFRTTCTP